MSKITSKPFDLNSQEFYSPKMTFGSLDASKTSDSSDELFAKNPPLPSFTIQNETKWIKTTKRIASIIVFPLGIYQLIHRLMGKIINPKIALNQTILDPKKTTILAKNGWKIKRLTIEVDGMPIEALILGKKSTLSNGKWFLVSNGRNETFQQKINAGDDIQNILTKTQANAIYFNYPGVQSNRLDYKSREATKKSYKAILTFLEDKKGISAKEIIGYGISLGGAIQADALKNHVPQKGIKYTFIKKQTFSYLSKIGAENGANRLFGIQTNEKSRFKKTLKSIFKPFVSLSIKLFGWNIETHLYSKKLISKEIIIQTSKTSGWISTINPLNRIERVDDVADDGVVSAGCSLAKKLLKEKTGETNSEWFLKKEIWGLAKQHSVLLNPKEINFLATRLGCL